MGSAKRLNDSSAPRNSSHRPSKKQRRLQAYHSDTDDSADQQDFKAVNLLDSDDDDLDDVEVDQGSISGEDISSSKLESELSKQPSARHGQASRRKPAIAADEAGGPPALEDDGFDSEEEEEGGEGDDDDQSSSESYSGSDKASSTNASNLNRKKSKRNDPAAFATSLSKILGSKLSAPRRRDPLLAGSAAAHEASRAAADSALEGKARRALREQKRAALEKGRVRDVLAPAPVAVAASVSATSGLTPGGGAGDIAAARTADGATEQSTAQLLETERRLRKVAQRGVVKLFNAVRAAQVKAAEAERSARAEGVVSHGAREERVTEMSRKGFLDLIASGGGGMKRGRLEEA